MVYFEVSDNLHEGCQEAVSVVADNFSKGEPTDGESCETCSGRVPYRNAAPHSPRCVRGNRVLQKSIWRARLGSLSRAGWKIDHARHAANWRHADFSE